MAVADSPLDRLLAEWAQSREGLAPVRRDGVYIFVFDGEYEIELSQDGAKILIRSSLDTLPTERLAAEALIERILSMQLGRSLRGEEIVTLEADGRQLTLFREIAVPDSAMRFSEIIGAFVNATAFWTRRIRAEITAELAPRGPQMNMMFP